MTDLVKRWEEKEKISQQDRKYLHFDQKTSIQSAKRFVTNPIEIGRHYFYPFIKNDIETKRFKKNEKGKRALKKKVRKIMYASHVDSLIYSYYNIVLGEKYEQAIAGTAFQASILAYRRLGKSNIEFALEVFEEIKDMGACVVLAFDVSNFFDTLDHSILKTHWQTVLGSGLNEHRDHRNIFNSITRFAYVEKTDLDKAFLTDSPAKPKRKLYRYCSGPEFREKVRGKDLIKPNPENRGIPQGSPISALLSNIYMLEFDRAAFDKIVTQNFGIYRRYCDDILVVCQAEHADSIEAWVIDEIKNRYFLEIQKEKTEKYQLVNEKNGNGIFRPINVDKGKRKNIQYLGFEFDGDHIFIRSSSVSRYYRRMKYRVHSAIYDATKNGGKVFKKKLLLKNTEHGVRISEGDFSKLKKTNPKLAEKRRFKGNFITYAKRAAARMGEDKILTQIKPHRRRLEKTIKEKLKGKS